MKDIMVVGLLVVLVGILALVSVADEGEATDPPGWSSLYSEDFDGLAEGSYDTGWTNDSLPPEINIVNSTHSASGSNSLKLNDSSGTGVIYRTVVFSDANLSFNAYFDDTTHQRYMYFYSGGGGYASDCRVFSLLFNHDGKIWYTNSRNSWRNSGVSYDAEWWLPVYLITDSVNHTISVNVNGTDVLVKESSQTNYLVVSSVVFYIVNTQMYIDDLSISGISTIMDYAIYNTYSEDFDGLSGGSYNTGWTNNSGGWNPDNNIISTTHAYSGTKSLMINDTTSTGAIYRNVKSSSLNLSFMVYFPDTTYQRQVMLYSGGDGFVSGDYVVFIYFMNGGAIKYKDSNGLNANTGYTYSADTWIDCNLNLNHKNQTYTFTVDGNIINGNRWVCKEYTYVHSVVFTTTQGQLFLDDVSYSAPDFTNDDVLSEIPDNNAFFNDEFNDNTSWVIGSGSISTDGGIGTLVKNTLAHKSVLFPGRDHLLYIKLKNNNITNYFMNITVSSSSSLVYSIFWDYNSSSSSPEMGTMSGMSYALAGVNYTSVFGTNLDFSAYDEFLIWFDEKTTYLNVYTRSRSKYEFLGSLILSSSDWDTNKLLNASKIELSTPNVIGGSTNIDYVSFCQPNFMSIGDSITAGHSYYDPDPAFYVGDDPYNNSYQYYCNLYGYDGNYVRNSFIVDKSDGSESTLDFYDNLMSEVVQNNPILLLLQSSDNDYSWYELGVKEDANQVIVDECRAHGVKVALLSSVVPNDNHSGYPAISDYFTTWNNNGLLNITNVVSIDFSVAINNVSGVISGAYCESDGIHPNIYGYEQIGNYIEKMLTYYLSINVSADYYDVFDGTSVTYTCTVEPIGTWYNWTVEKGSSIVYSNGTDSTYEHEFLGVGNYTVSVSVSDPRVGGTPDNITWALEVNVQEVEAPPQEPEAAVGDVVMDLLVGVFPIILIIMVVKMVAGDRRNRRRKL